MLLYISQDDHLAAAMFNHRNSRSWMDASTFFNVTQYITAPGSRSFALSQVPETNESSILSLWFTNPSGGVTGLLGSHPQVLPQFSPTVLGPFWSWTNTTTALAAGLPSPNWVVSEPFSITLIVYYQSATTTAVSIRGPYAMYFIPSAAPREKILYAKYINDTCSEGAYFQILSPTY